MNKKLTTFILILITILPACSSQVRGESPQVAINLLQLDGQQLTVELRIRNLNDVPLNITSMPYSIDFDGQALLHGGQSVRLSIGPRGTEISQERIAISATDSQLFAQLESRQIPNLGYQLEGELHSETNQRIKFDFSSRLFIVPGKPHEYR